MAVDLKMEVYTPALELVGMLNTWKSIMWEEKAFTAGSFSMDSLITSETRELLVKENIIWIEGYTAGTIEHIEKKSDKTGPYVTVKGRLLTGILDRRILWGLYNLSGKPADIMHRLVDDCCVHPTRGNVEARVIPNLVLLSPDTVGTSISIQKTGGTLLEALELYGETYNVAFGVRFNAAVPQMEFWTRYGVNRSVHQTENDPVFYSTELDDVLSSEYSYDSSSWRNVGLVAGEGEGSDRVYVTVEDYDESQGGNGGGSGGGSGGGDVTPPPVEIPTYTITATVDPSGSGSVTGAGQYKEGESVSLAATANDGYNFAAWKEGGATVHGDADYMFTAEKSRDLVATFEESQKKLVYISAVTVLSRARNSLASTTVGDYALFGGGIGTSSSNVVDAYDKELTRTTPTALSVARYRLNATTVGDYALFGGGNTGTAVSSVVNAYDKALTRTTPTALSKSRYNLASTTVGDYALFGGGNVSTSPSNVVNAYDKALTRTTPTALSAARYYLASTTVGDYALFGGGIGTSSSNVVDAYDKELTRTTPTALSVARYEFAATTVGDYALFVGGYAATNVVDAYDKELTRTTPTALSVARYEFAATTVGDYALFGGGNDNTAATNVVDAYDKELTRTTPTALSVARYEFAATTVGDYALFVGGYDNTAASNVVDAYTLQ